MKNYRPQLRVNSYDERCSASCLGDNIIGVLFDKKGSEIKRAIDARLSNINEKIEDYQSMTTKVEVFIDKKRAVLKDLDVFYQARCDEKSALIKPHQKNIDEILKKCKDDVDDILRHSSDLVFDFDKGTYKKIGEHAIKFEEGFDEFKVNFLELDEFLKKEEEVVKDTQDHYNGPCGCTGIQGSTGLQGVRGYEGQSGPSSYSQSQQDIAKVSDKILCKLSSTEEDKAISKLRTLRDYLQKYFNKIELLKKCIKQLEDERRILMLIKNSIEDTRVYKLDLNKLSAFGFEDLNVTDD